MDSPEFPTSKPSPRKELQGPRPAPLKVRKDSFSIKKPPVVPKPPQPSPQHRPPLIIYAVSPKVIHTNATDFMTIVQRLTGSSSSSSSSLSPSSQDPISPAARFAAIEKTSTCTSEGVKSGTDYDLSIIEGLDIDGSVERTGSIPGILSPIPSSLPPISPNFFSPIPDPNSLSFLHDLSPIFHGNKNYIEGSFMTTPTTFFSNTISSPTLSFDLFNQFLDF